ncbi:MAG: hypothetical protein HY690_15950 [Chloroflexi bacterium]|nr:hypothetical protein [Chloroflexota bacterium]
MMVDLPDELAERVRKGHDEFGLPGRPSASRVLLFLIERGLRAVEDERREAARRATYDAWADGEDALADAERNFAQARTEGRL